MNQAPFSLSIVVFATYVVAFLIGGLLMVLFAGAGLGNTVGLALAAFIPVPLNGIVRSMVASALAQVEGASGRSPVAFSYPVRLVIGAVIAALAAYGLSVAQLGFGFLVGGLAAVLTAMVLSLIFTFAVASRTSG